MKKERHRETCASCACNLQCLTADPAKINFSRCLNCNAVLLRLLGWHVDLTTTVVSDNCYWVQYPKYKIRSNGFDYQVTGGGRNRWRKAARDFYYDHMGRLATVAACTGIQKIATNFFCDACAPAALETVKRAAKRREKGRQKNAES